MNSSKIMKTVGTGILFLVWLWLAWGLLSADGVNLKNLLILAMTAVIIFVPLYKKYFAQGADSGSRNDRRK